MLIISCKKKYSQAEKNRIEEMNSSQVYKVKVPDDAFVFCLDTIKADDEYQRFSEEFCRRGQGVDSYLYLSSYKVYIPVFVEYSCGTIGCYFRSDMLLFSINKQKEWFVDGELISNLNQKKIDDVLSGYYKKLKNKERNKKSLIKFNVRAIKNNKERDSLYVNLLSSYYNFIKKEKHLSGERIENLLVEFPFNLSFGEYLFLPPPPPPPADYDIIGIKEDIE